VKRHPAQNLLLAVAVMVLGLAGFLNCRRTPPKPPTPSHSRLTSETGTEMDPSLSPDGRSFAYVRYHLGHWDIHLRQVSGGEVINLTEHSEVDDLHPAFSPDGKQVAFSSRRSGGGIFVTGTEGEAVRQLTDFGYYPAWSPDGERIVFTTESVRYAMPGIEKARIWTVVVASGDLRLVVAHSALQPDWSPNGHRIAFWGTSPGEDSNHDIFTVAAAGGLPVAATQDPSFDAEPVWSPDGRYLYFRSLRGETENLWRIPIDEETGEVLGEAEPVTSGSFEHLGGISIAREADRLAYHVFTRSAQIQRAFYDPETEMVTGGPIPVTPPGLSAIHPSVSPDGEWLAFTAEFAGADIWTLGIIGAGGTDLQQLTESTHNEFLPTWSPDGERIAFYSDRSGSFEGWVVGKDGSGLQQLTDTPGKTVLSLRWSPDGRRLATAVNHGSAYVFDAEKPWTEQPPTELPRFEAPGNVFWKPWSWSPDGAFLAGCLQGFNEDGSAAEGIVLYSLETSEYRQVTDFGWNPLFLANGRRILILNWAEPVELLLLDFATGEIEGVLSAASLGIAPDRINYWPALSPDNRTIFFDRLHSEADIWLMTLGE